MIAIRNPQSAIRNLPYSSFLIPHSCAVLAYLAGAALFTWPWITAPGRYGGALLACAATGWGMFLLGHSLSGSYRAGFVAGAALTFWGWHVARLQWHPTLTETSNPVPLLGLLLYMVFLVRGAGPAWANTLAAALAVTLMALSADELLVYGALFTVGWALDRGLDRNVAREAWLRGLGRAGGAAILGLGLALLLTVVLAPAMADSMSIFDTLPPSQQFRLLTAQSADLGAYLVPGWQSTMFGSRLPTWLLWLDEMTAVFPGWSVWVLGVYGLIRAWPRTRLWHGVGLAGLLLSFGPVLSIFGLDVPMPFYFFYALPGRPFMLSPVHFAVLVQIALAVGLAYGLADLLRRLQGAERLELLASRTEILEFRVPSIKPHLLFAVLLLAIMIEQLIIPLSP